MTTLINPRLETPYLNLTTVLFVAIFALHPLSLISIILSDRWMDIVTLDWFSMMWQMPLVNLVAIWLFLRQPHTTIRKSKMQLLSKTHPDVMSKFAVMAKKINIKEIPIILLIPKTEKDNRQIFAFGTWRKKYIAISEKVLNRWKDSDSFEVALLHELGHIGSGDLWKTELSKKFLICLGIQSCLQASILFYNALRFSNLMLSAIIFNISISGATVVLLITLRLLLHIREFAADEYVLLHINKDIQLQRSFLAYSIIDAFSDHQTSSKFPNKWLNWLPHFHPSFKMRIQALQNKSVLDQQISVLFLVLGLIIGQFTTSYAEERAGQILISWLILVSPFFLCAVLSTSYLNNTAEKIWLTLKSTTYIAIGAIAIYTIQVLPFLLLKETPANNISLISNQFGLPDGLGKFFDNFFVLILLLPPLSFLQSLVFVALSNKIYSNFRKSNLFTLAWLIQLPLNLFEYRKWLDWTFGNDITLQNFVIFGAIWIMWIFGVVLVVKYLSNKQKGM